MLRTTPVARRAMMDGLVAVVATGMVAGVMMLGAGAAGATDAAPSSASAKDAAVPPPTEALAPLPSAIAPSPDDDARSGYPVSLDGEVLFVIRQPLGAFTAGERAERASSTILGIARDPFYEASLIQIEDLPDRSVVSYRGQMIGTIYADEAAEMGTTPQALTHAIVQRVRVAIDAYRARREPEAWTRGLLELGLATLMFAAAIVGTRRLYARLLASPLFGDTATGPIASFWQRHASIAVLKRRALRFARNVLFAVLTIVYLQVAFFVLPVTQGITLGLLAYVIRPLETLWQGILANIGDFFFIVVLLFLTRIVLRIMRWLAGEAAAGRLSVPMVSSGTSLVAYKVARLAVLAVAGMMIYPYIPGSNSAAFKGIGLFAGALFTLGASGTASSLIGGVTLIFTNVFRVGDRVQIGSVMGDVVEVTLLITRLRTPKNEVVTFSNGNVMASHVVNFSAEARGRGLILHTEVTIGYDVPWRRVHELLIEAATRTETILHQPEPFVLQRSLDDFYVTYELNAYSREATRLLRTYSDLHANIQDAFNAAGIEIMSPHRFALRDGATSTVPAEHRPAEPAQPFVVRVDPLHPG